MREIMFFSINFQSISIQTFSKIIHFLSKSFKISTISLIFFNYIILIILDVVNLTNSNQF